MNKSEYRGFTQVFRFTLKQALGSTAFRATTLIMVVIMLVAFPVMAYFNKDEDEVTRNIEKVYVINDGENSLGLTASAFTSGLDGSESTKKLVFEDSAKTKDELVEQISENHANEIILSAVIDELMGNYSFKLYMDPDSEVSSEEVDELGEDLAAWFDKYKLQTFGISDDALAMVNRSVFSNVMDVSDYLDDGSDVEIISSADYNIVYAILMIVYMIVAISAGMVANKVVEEKANRVVEYLMTTVRPMALVTGKVIATLIAAIGEVTVILLAGFVSSKVAEKVFGTNVTASLTSYITTDALSGLSVINVIACLVMLGLGIYIFGLLAGLFAASVSKMEELQQGIMGYSMILLIAFFMGLASVELMWTVGINGFVKFTMIFPLTSVYVLPGSLIIGEAGLLATCIAIALQLLTAIIIQRLVSLVYETIIVMNGNPVKFRQMLQIAKQSMKNQKKIKMAGGAGDEQ